MGSDDKPADELAVLRATRFLKELKSSPFVALVFDGQNIKVYHKGLGPDEARRIEEFVETMIPEGN